LIQDGDRCAPGAASRPQALKSLNAELGPIAAQGASKAEELVAVIDNPGDGRRPPRARAALGMPVEQLRSARARIRRLAATLLAWPRSNQTSRRLAAIPGVGVITATAPIATIGDGARFRSGRPLSAWLGLVPRQHSSGGNDRLERISKRGDGTIGRWLVQAARIVLRWRRGAGHASRLDRPAARGGRQTSCWSPGANKTARAAWARIRCERITRPTPA